MNLYTDQIKGIDFKFLYCFSHINNKMLAVPKTIVWKVIVYTFEIIFRNQTITKLLANRDEI